METSYFNHFGNSFRVFTNWTNTEKIGKHFCVKKSTIRSVIAIDIKLHNYCNSIWIGFFSSNESSDATDPDPWPFLALDLKKVKPTLFLCLSHFLSIYSIILLLWWFGETKKTWNKWQLTKWELWFKSIDFCWKFRSQS